MPGHKDKDITTEGQKNQVLTFLGVDKNLQDPWPSELIYKLGLIVKDIEQRVGVLEAH